MRQKQFDSIIANYNLHKRMSDTKAPEHSHEQTVWCCSRTRYDAGIGNCVLGAAVAAAVRS